jgi:hypothetical protein
MEDSDRCQVDFPVEAHIYPKVASTISFEDGLLGFTFLACGSTPRAVGCAVPVYTDVTPRLESHPMEMFFPCEKTIMLGQHDVSPDSKINTGFWLLKRN